MPKPHGDRTNVSFETQSIWLRGLLQQAQRAKFYGKLTIIMEDGNIHRVIEEKSLKPPVEKTLPE